MAEIGAKSLILDLFRVVPAGREVAVRDLVAITGLFGITGNATRVAVARLAGDGVLESARRGQYRLTESAVKLGDWVEAWRLGDERLRSWEGAWLAAEVPAGLERGARERTVRALGRFGLRPELGLMVRPDNLAAPAETLARQLADHGAAPGLELFVIAGASPALASRLASLWPVAELAAERRRQTAVLRRSAKTVAGKPAARALVETFTLGGAAIRLLARDPLLPDAIASGEPRRELTEAMLEYDRLGRSLWAGALEVARAPAQLAEVAVG